MSAPPTISGAVHAVVNSLTSVAEFIPRTIEANSKFAKRAWQSRSTRILSYRGLLMRLRTSRRKHPPLSSFRVWCGLSEDSEGLRLHPTTWQGHALCQVRLRGRLTRLIRFAPGFFSMNSTSVSLGTHSEMICNGSVVTPTKGTTFGCLSLFQVMASLKNDYKTHRFS